MCLDIVEESLLPLLCDAHCHPHDAVDRLGEIPKLKVGHVALMGTKLDDWDHVRSIQEHEGQGNEKNSKTSVPKCLPCYGIHPWYAHLVATESSSFEQEPSEHYKACLKSKDTSEVDAFAKQLPSPTPYRVWFTRLREYILSYPYALVGEVGLDKSARLLPLGSTHWHGVKPTTTFIDMDHQLAILGAQLDLAAELDRAASIHCVQAYGALLGLLQSKIKVMRKMDDSAWFGKPLRVCVHSYGGSTDMMKSLLALPDKYVQVYISFSVAINGRLGDRLKNLIAAVPKDRLLLESDYDRPDGLEKAMLEICSLAAKSRQMDERAVAEQTTRNWERFVGIR